MDPVTLVAAALTAGAAAGLKGTASAAVNDAYNGLRNRLKERLAGKPSAELVLAKHETAPDAWRAPLEEELAVTGVERDLEEAARALIELLGANGRKFREYHVDVRHSQGVIIGDHGSQENTFGDPKTSR